MGKRLREKQTPRVVSPLKRNIFFQYLLQIATYIFPFITLPYLTRVLGPDVYAIRAYAVSFMALAFAIMSYGFNQYGTREVALHKGDKVFLSKLTSVICLLRLVLVLVVGLAVVAMMSFIPLMAANPVYMFITFGAYALTAMLPDFVFQGLEDMAVMTQRYVISKLVSVVLIFTFVKGPEDIILVAVFEFVTSFIAYVWSWANVLRLRGIRLSLSCVSLGDFVSCFKVSTIFFISNAMTTLFTGLTTVMIGIFVKDPAQVSYWSLATTAISAVQCLYSPIVNSIYPHVVANRDLHMVKKILLLGFPFVVAGTVTFWFLSDVVMLILGGSEYMSGSYVVRLIAPVLLFSYPAQLLGFPVLAAVGCERKMTLSSVAGAVFHVVGLVILVAAGVFTVASVALLRSATEFVFMLVRAIFVFRWDRKRKNVNQLTETPTLEI